MRVCTTAPEASRTAIVTGTASVSISTVATSGATTPPRSHPLVPQVRLSDDRTVNGTENVSLPGAPVSSDTSIVTRFFTWFPTPMVR